MWVNEGLALIERAFPSMVPRINHGEGNEWTAKGLHELAIRCSEGTTVAGIIKEADSLGLHVSPDGNVTRL